MVAQGGSRAVRLLDMVAFRSVVLRQTEQRLLRCPPGAKASDRPTPNTGRLDLNSGWSRDSLG